MQLVEIAYFTGRVKEMTKFYKAFLGLEPIAQSDDMAIFVNEGVKIFINKNYITGEGDLPPENHTAYVVDRLGVVCEALQTSVWEIERPPQVYYWGESAYLRDPDGHLIELIQATRK